MQERIVGIENLDIYIIKIPLVKPFETSLAVETHKEALLVKLTGSGISGWGECVASPGPYYSYETNETAYHIIKDFLVPLLHGQNKFSIDDALVSFGRIRRYCLENSIDVWSGGMLETGIGVQVLAGQLERFKIHHETLI